LKIQKKTQKEKKKRIKGKETSTKRNKENRKKSKEKETSTKESVWTCVVFSIRGTLYLVRTGKANWNETCGPYVRTKPNQQ
jgi:hypothetical protein